MLNLLRDLRFGFRMLWKDPAFTALAVLTLALGIGANTAIFSLGNVFMFRPLPVKDATRLTVVTVQNTANGEPSELSYPDFLTYRERAGAFTDMTGYVIDLVGLGSHGHADRLVASYVPSNFFAMLGIRPAIGRMIVPGEGDAPGTGPVVVLGHSYWKKRFGGDPRVVGSSVNVDGHAVTVVGVVPQEFLGLYNIVEMDAYLPIGMLRIGSHPDFFTERGDREVRVLGALKPGVTVRQAQAALQVVADRLAQAYPQADKGQIVRVFPEPIARPEPAAADSKALVAAVFLIMVGLVLVVACVNVANLLLARSAVRQKEIAVRAAMGAGRARLIRQLLTESLLLAAFGGVGGAVMGNWVIRGLENLRPIGDFQVRLAFTFDWRVFAYTSAVVLLAGVAAGLAPAWRISRTDLNESLREGGRGIVGDGGRRLLRNGLVVAQVAGSLVVLVAAGLFTRSLNRAESIDLGFDPRNVLNVGLDPGMQGYGQPRAEAFFRELLRRARALPGVESASLAFSVPMSYYNDTAQVYVEGQTLPPGSRVPGAPYNCVSPDYFSTMRMPILSGRAFAESDTATSEPVAIVNRTMAERFWPHQDAVGKRFSYKGASGPFVTVAGVARDAKLTELLDKPRMYFFLPQTQNYKSLHVLQLRTAAQPESLAPAVEALVRGLDPDLPAYDVMSMEKSLQGANGFFLIKMGASFATALGGLGLLLAVVGVYGTVSFSANRRRHEIGIRMALGAQSSSVLKLVMGQALALVAAGLGIGLLAALAVMRVMSSLLVNVGSSDPPTYAAVAALLAGVALVACYIPARRAAHIDPMTALRHE